jgi:hypothetical protein
MKAIVRPQQRDAQDLGVRHEVARIERTMGFEVDRCELSGSSGAMHVLPNSGPRL